MHTILVEGMEVYAYHGCLEEEGKVGGQYVVDVSMDVDFAAAAAADDLGLTVDYVRVYEIVKSQMAIRARLIETVAARIGEEIRKAYPGIVDAEVRVTKVKPPIHGAVKSTSVVYRFGRRGG